MRHGPQIFICRFGRMDPVQLEGRWLAPLQAREQARYRALGHNARRREWLTGRALACEALTLLLGGANPEALHTGNNGGLIYEEAGLHLSLSHSRGLVALAVAAMPVGVDVERLRPRRLTNQAEKIFAPAEAARLAKASASERRRQFYRYWTLKEAFCKAAGVSVWQSLRAAEFDLERGAFTAHAPLPSGDWHFLSACLARDWCMALAVPNRRVQLPAEVRRRHGKQWRSQKLIEPVWLRAAAH